MAQQTTAEPTTIGTDGYVADILQQDGLYIGLGLGAVVGALVASRNIEVALGYARNILKATETLTADLNKELMNNS